MSVATPYGYNEFDVVKVYQGIAGESNLKVQGARESSVCMYVKGFKNYDQVVMFASAMKRARVDEFAMLDKGGRPILRSWNVQDYMNVVDKGARATEYELPADFKEIRCWWD
jgi:hypothetical protein